MTETDLQQRGFSPHLLNLAILLLFLWQGLSTLARHEAWRDEAQAWLIARDANLSTLFELRPLEARPAVWDLLLVPLAKSGLPMFSGELLHFALATGTLILVLWKAPLHWTVKLAFTFSYFPFWEYAIVMRIYAAAMFWLICLAALYSRRFEYPGTFAAIVFLLFNTSIHAFCITSVITLLFAIDAVRQGHRSPRVWGAFIVMTVGAVACLIQIYMPSDHPHIVRGSFHKAFDYTQLMSAMSSTIAAGWQPNRLTILCGAITLGLVCLAFLPRWQLLLLTLANLSGLFYIFGKIGGGVRHHGFIHLGILFCLWIAPVYSVVWPNWLNWRMFTWLGTHGLRFAAAILTCSFLLSLPPTWQLHASDRRLDFSAGYRMAEYLRSHQMDGKTIAAFPSGETLAILGYLPHVRFWYPGIEEYGTFVRQDLKRTLGDEISMAEAIQRIHKQFPQDELPLLISSQPPDSMDRSACELIFRVDESVFGTDDKLYLYLLSRENMNRPTGQELGIGSGTTP